MGKLSSGAALALTLLLACGSSTSEQTTESQSGSPPGTPTSTTETTTGSHTTAQAGGCGAEAACAADEQCVGQQCRPRCAVDAECGEARCHLATGTCAAGPCRRSTDCAPGDLCDDGWCVPEPPPLVCTPHTVRCDGDDLVVCEPEGRREVREPCRYGCISEATGDHCGERRCHPWAVGCRDDGHAWACDAIGAEVQVTECDAEAYCEAGQCLPRVCSPAAQWCVGDALVTCDDRGSGYAVEPCSESPACADPDGSCVCREDDCQAVACLPGSGRCVGRGLERCNPEGTGYFEVETCGPEHACREGACHAVVCEPDWRQCRGDMLATCDATGTNIIETDCADEEAYCEGTGPASACAPQACRPGSGVCTQDATALLRCDDRGTGTEVVECAEWGCSAGACLPEPPPEGWVRVQPGTMQMGSPPDELGRMPYEILHEVRITQPFFLKATEVTQAEFEAVMGTRPSYFTECGGDCPVELVSFFDAVAYANQLSLSEGHEPCYTLTGCSGVAGSGCAGEFLCPGDYTCETVAFRGIDCPGYRLPTEAEWEYAARAGSGTAFYAGSITMSGTDPIDPVLADIAWYGGNSDGTTHPVGTRQPNALQLYDMSGNVFELVWDWFTVDYEDLSAVDPLGPPRGENRVARGGSWFNEAVRARSAYRHNLPPDRRVNSFGFRLARTSLEPPGQGAD